MERRGLWTLHGILSDWWLPAILTTWLVWVPSLLVVYSLPTALQFIMFSIIMTFWTIIQLILEEDAKDDSPVEENRMGTYQGTSSSDYNDENSNSSSNSNAASTPIMDYSALNINNYSAADNEIIDDPKAPRYLRHSSNVQ